MTIADLQIICEKLPGTTQDIKWEDHLCFNTGGKMYLITSPDQAPPAASFKATAEDFEALCEREGFTPAPYLARYQWVHVDDISRLSRTAWEKYIERSHKLVFSKLPARVRKELTPDD